MLPEPKHLSINNFVSCFFVYNTEEQTLLFKKISWLSTELILKIPQLLPLSEETHCLHIVALISNTACVL